MREAGLCVSQLLLIDSHSQTHSEDSNQCTQSTVTEVYDWLILPNMSALCV